MLGSYKTLKLLQRPLGFSCRLSPVAGAPGRAGPRPRARGGARARAGAGARGVRSPQSDYPDYLR